MALWHTLHCGVSLQQTTNTEFEDTICARCLHLPVKDLWALTWNLKKQRQFPLFVVSYLHTCTDIKSTKPTVTETKISFILLIYLYRNNKMFMVYLSLDVEVGCAVEMSHWGNKRPVSYTCYYINSTGVGFRSTMKKRPSS